MPKRDDKLALYSEWAMRLYFLRDEKGTVRFFIDKLEVVSEWYFYGLFNRFKDLNIFIEIPEEEKRLGGIMTKVYKIDENALIEYLKNQTFFILPYLIISDYRNDIVIEDIYSSKEKKELREKYAERNN